MLVLNRVKKALRTSIISKVTAANSTVILAAFVIMATVISTINYNLSVSKERQVMVAYLNNALSSVDNKLKDMARVSLMSYSDPTTQDMLQNIDSYSYGEREKSLEYLENLYSTLIIIRDDINGIYIFSNDSLVVRRESTSRSAVKSDADIPGFIRWMEEVEQEESGYVSHCKLRLERQPDFLWNRMTSDPFEQHCVYMIREVKRFSPNDRIGHILLVSPVSVLREVLQEFLDPHSSYMLIGQDGTIFCCGDGSLLGENLGSIYPDIFASLEGAQGTFRGRMYGESSMISYEQSSYSGLTLITAKPLRYLYGDTVTFILLIIAVSAVLIFAAILFTGRSTRRFIQPIHALTGSMASFGKGNTRISLPVTSEDESGQLTQSFNLMMDTINDLIFSEYENTINLRTAQLRQKEAQLLYLRSQINPHFLYNTLDTIRIKAAINGDVEVADMIMLLVEFFRFSMGVTTQLVPLEHEIHLIQVYLKLMRYRYPKLQDVYQIDDSLRGVKIPSFMLQPLVENSLLHGLKSVSYDGRITVGVRRDDECPSDILIEISDNGVGMDAQTRKRLEGALRGVWPFPGEEQEEESGKKGFHIGISNVQRRLEMFYSGRYGLHYQPSPDGGVTAVIRIKDQTTEEYPD